MRTNIVLRVLALIVAGLASIGGPAVAADEVQNDEVVSLPAAKATPRHSLLNDRLRVSLGGFYADTNTSARLTTNTGGVGADVNFEDALGLSDRKLVGEASLYWRFGERWRLDVDYVNIGRSATRTLSQEVVWGGQTFPIGTDVNAQSRISDLRTAVGYSFFKRSDKEVGFGVGLHWTGLKFSLDSSGSGAEAASVTAPLPVVYMYSNVALTDTWAMSTRLDWLSLNYDKYSGNIRAVAFDFIYQPYTHVAFGMGWHAMLLGLGVNNPDSQMQYRLALQGPAAYASYSF